MQSFDSCKHIIIHVILKTISILCDINPNPCGLLLGGQQISISGEIIKQIAYTSLSEQEISKKVISIMILNVSLYPISYPIVVGGNKLIVATPTVAAKIKQCKRKNLTIFAWKSVEDMFQRLGSQHILLQMNNLKLPHDQLY